MKKTLPILAILLIASCTSPTENATNKEDLAPIDKIANNYGYASFHLLDSLAFTFEVDHPNGTMQRHWKWAPRQNRVTAIHDTGQVSFKRGSITDSTLMQLDAQFVNDKYWTLFPFQMKWDSTEVKYYGTHAAPVSGATLPSIQLTYPEASGYTPGDSYTVYYDSTYTIQEWTYCPDGDCERGSSYAWAKRQEQGPFTFTTAFKNAQKTVTIRIKDIKVFTH